MNSVFISLLAFGVLANFCDSQEFFEDEDMFTDDDSFGNPYSATNERRPGVAMVEQRFTGHLFSTILEGLGQWYANKMKRLSFRPTSVTTRGGPWCPASSRSHILRANQPSTGDEQFSSLDGDEEFYHTEMRNMELFRERRDVVEKSKNPEKPKPCWHHVQCYHFDKICCPESPGSNNHVCLSPRLKLKTRGNDILISMPDN